MTVHPMVPTDYTTPDGLRALDDATRVGGALTGIFAAMVAAALGVRRWWHRRRDRQERVLREVVAAVEERLDRIEARLDGMHEGVVEIRTAQVRHLEAHTEGRTG